MGEFIIPDSTEPAGEPASAADFPRPHVLIVDDHDGNRTVCAGYCDLFDHTSETARNQAEALEALSQRRFDVVVMNVHMADALGALRGLPALAAETPIIGLAAPGHAEEAQRWLAAGLAGVVAKPVTAARLFAAINSVLTPPPRGARSWAPAA